MKTKIVALTLFAALCMSLCSCGKVEKSTQTALLLDTIVSVTCYGEGSDEAANAAIDEIKRIEAIFSPYIETSEIYNINHNAHSAPVKVTDEVMSVLKEALRICALTDGAFDITIKPLVDLWNIKAENPSVPSPDAIAEAKSKVDWTKVELSDGTVRLGAEGMMLDLGGAAKGYAADCAVKVIRDHGIKDAILDLGGNVYAMGSSEKGSPWRIGLQDPDGKRGEYFKAEELSDLSCVTSGSYERYFESGGRIYHHIINPKTGYCADEGLISVSVIGKSSFEADMLSTAIFVMGAEEFEKIKDNFDIVKYIIVDKTNNWKAY